MEDPGALAFQHSSTRFRVFLIPLSRLRGRGFSQGVRAGDLRQCRLPSSHTEIGSSHRLAVSKRFERPWSTR